MVINEIQSSNATTIADEDGDFEDWIELYNGTDTEINLAEYYLSDDINNLQMWNFPEVIIESSEFLLIFASGKDRKESPFLHTNFSIDKNGETVLLSDNNGIITDYLTPVYIPTDHSFGRIPDGSIDFRFFTQPSPGSTNTGPVLNEVLTPVQFSTQGGFYTDEFYLHLSHPDPNAIIVYTLDGSEPDIDNLDGNSYYFKQHYPMHPNDSFGDFFEKEYRSILYTSPILIENRSNSLDNLTQISTTIKENDYSPLTPVYKGTVVRAKAYKDNSISDWTSTHSYFISQKGRRSFPVTIISISVPEKSLFDYYQGIHVPGIITDNWRESNPSENLLFWEIPGNYYLRGTEFERESNIEIFPAHYSQSVLNQTIGLRIHGSSSRSFCSKSFRLYARSSYGISNFNYKIFENSYHNSFKRLVIRNSAQDFGITMMRDVSFQRILENMNFNNQDFTPSVLFINGEYWGIYHIRERIDKYYLNRKYSVDTDQIDLLVRNSWISEGSNSHYIETLEYIEQNGLSDENDYSYIKTRIDIDNFIDYQIAQIYVRNTDWPENNISFWRKQTINFDPTAPQGHDGRWRWLLYDLDAGFGLYGGAKHHTENTLEYATNNQETDLQNPPHSTFLLRSLLENDTFRQDFINRFEYHLLHTFHPNRVIPIIDSIADIIRPLIPLHSHRWNQGRLTISDWEKNVDVMREFAIKRPCVMREHIKDFFNIKNDDYAIGACEYDIFNSSQRYEDLITLYPNPANDVIYVEFPNDIHYFTEIRIIDNTGRQITHFETKIFRNILEINISSLNPGLYLLNISTVEHYFAKRFVILR